MEIYLIRHPAVAVVKGTCYGQTDVALAADYEQQLMTWRSRWPECLTGIAYASDLSRCALPAREIFGSDLILDARLRELDFGEWEGRLWRDIPKEEIDYWMANMAEKGPPSGETGKAMMDRCLAFLNDLPADLEKVCLLSHGGWIRMLLAHVLELSPLSAFRIELDFLGVTKLHRRKGWFEVSFVNRN